MKNLIVRRALFASLVAAGAIASSMVIGQQFQPPSGNQPLGFPPNNPSQLSYNYNANPIVSPTIGQAYGQTILPDGTNITNRATVPAVPLMTPEEVQKHNGRRQAVQAAMTKWKSKDASEEDKKEARESIEKFLRDEFERDQKNRKDQIERLAEQVSKLRSQVEKREASQSKIIELRMQLLENDAEGLAFPEAFNDLNRFPNQLPAGMTHGIAPPAGQSNYYYNPYLLLPNPPTYPAPSSFPKPSPNESSPRPPAGTVPRAPKPSVVQ